MALRREQPVEQVEQIAGNPAIEEKRQGIPASANPIVQDNEDTQLQEHENLHLHPLQKNWTNMNSRTLCFVPGANTVFPAVPKKIHIAVLQHMKVAL